MFSSPVPQLPPSIRCCPDTVCSAILFRGFPKNWTKEPFPSTCLGQRSAASFPSFCMTPFSSSSLYSCNCCLICVRRGLLRGDAGVCRYQIAALEDGSCKTSILKCSILETVFASVPLCPCFFTLASFVLNFSPSFMGKCFCCDVFNSR